MNLRAYKYRIYPTQPQEILLAKTFGCVRVVWNQLVEIFNSYHKENNPKPVYKTSTQIRHELPWMQEVSAAAVQQKEKDFKEFRKNFFNTSRKSRLGRPQFKSKCKKQSYRLPNQKFDLLGNTIRLEKIGHVPIRIDRLPPQGCKFMSVTVSKDSTNKYFASILVEEQVTPRYKPTHKSVGVDLGLRNFLTTSDGEKVPNPRWYRESQTELAQAQRHLSRKVSGSWRYHKCRLKVARIHSKISNQRKWFHHQVANKLLKDFDVIGIENLHVEGIKRSRNKGKSVSDVGWGNFLRILDYKAVWNNKVVQRVDRWFPSSKMCGNCGCVNSNLRQGDETWTCADCGVTHDRDINAASNIGLEAQRIYQAQGVACAIRAPSGCKTGVIDQQPVLKRLKRSVA